MLKYLDIKVTFAEVPDEITLCVNITGCKNGCKGCHSPYLAEDIGIELTPDEVRNMIDKNKGITCISFMGGDSDPHYLNWLAWIVKSYYPKLKVAWYSGKQELSKDVNLRNFDVIKIGPYKEELGPLNSKTTNQRIYRTHDGELEDITSRFWKEL